MGALCTAFECATICEADSHCQGFWWGQNTPYCDLFTYDVGAPAKYVHADICTGALLGQEYSSLYFCPPPETLPAPSPSVEEPVRKPLTIPAPPKALPGPSPLVEEPVRKPVTIPAPPEALPGPSQQLKEWDLWMKKKEYNKHAAEWDLWSGRRPSRRKAAKQAEWDAFKKHLEEEEPGTWTNRRRNLTLPETLPGLGNSTNSTELPGNLQTPNTGMVFLGLLGLGFALVVFISRRSDLPLLALGQEARRPKSKQLTMVELDGPFYGTYDIHDDTASILANEGGPRIDVGSYAPPAM